MAFSWDPVSRRYRDLSSGKYLSMTRIRGLREKQVTGNLASVDALSVRLAAGEITVADWTLQMRAELKRVTIDQYLLARGGRNAMKPADWGRVGYQLRSQYGYLQQFAQEIDAGLLSDKQIAARARLYIQATRSAFERGLAAGWQVVLPEYPGDGNQICRTACRCRWAIRPTDEGTEARWIVNPGAEHCDSCLNNAQRWNPLVFPLITYPDDVDPETGLYQPAA